jgi:ferritin
MEKDYEASFPGFEKWLIKTAVYEMQHLMQLLQKLLWDTEQ